MAKIVLRSALNYGLQEFPAGYDFELERIPKKFKKFLKEKFEENPNLFSGDVEVFIDLPKKEVELPDNLEDLENLELKDLKSIGKQLEVRGWPRCGKPLIIKRIKEALESKDATDNEPDNDLLPPADDSGKAEEGTESSIKKEDLEIIEETEENVTVVATAELIELCTDLVDVKVGDHIEFGKDEFDELIK